jgi:PAS domain S-box-containing protein
MKPIEMGRQHLKGMCALGRTWLCILLCYFNLGYNLPGQKRIKFEHITNEQGLSQNTIYSIFQDNKGFLWVGTEDGLNRYDGYDFTVYRFDPDKPGSLSNNGIHAICADNTNTLWVGTEEGLNRFDRLHGRFTCYRCDPQKSAVTLGDNFIYSLLVDHTGTLWIGTARGLSQLNRENETFTSYLPPLPDDNDENAYTITSLCEDSSHNLWVGTVNGIYRFNREKANFSGEYSLRLSPENPGRECSHHIVTLYEDRSGTLWAGTKDGVLLKFDQKNRHFIPYQYDEDIPIYDSKIELRSIFQDKSGDFWIGTYGAGLYKLDTKSRTAVNYQERRGVPTSLSSNHIYTLYQDKGGVIWIGTEDGLNKLDKRKNEFAHWTTEPDNENSLSDNNVWSIYKDKADVLWIGTDKGLNRFDRKTGIFTHYTNNPHQAGTLSHNRVMAIFEDHLGFLWIGTQEGGLNKFDRKTAIFTHYGPPRDIILPPGKSLHLDYVSGRRVHVIFADHLETLWIGTRGGGLNRLDRETMTFTCYMPNPGHPGPLSHSHVSSIFEDKDGTLWVGTADGLNRFNRETETFTPYHHDKNDPYSLSEDDVSTIYESKTGTLWVGTNYGGLNRLTDRKKGVFNHYRQKDGLPNDTIYGILEDEDGCLWLSTVNGLSKFNPGSGEFKNYFAADGLQSNEFNGGAWFKAPDGEMFFGGMNGFNAFYPQRIKDNPHLPPVVITGFLVFNKPYLETPVTELAEVVLTHKDYVFSIEFSALDFSIPGKNIYEHKMEKVDPDWVRGNAQKRFVTYTNLSPGKYRFRVRGTNNDGVWSTREATLNIIIKPPFWQTWWFRVLLALLGVLAALSLYRARTRWLRKKLARQQQIRKILEQSHDEMERAKDLAELRHAENEKLLSAISSLFIAVDSNGIIFQWNKTSETFFGIGSAEVIKKPFIEVLRDFISENQLNEIIEKGLAQETSSNLIEFSIDLKSRGKGSRVLASTINPIRDSAGRTLGFLFMAEDITHRREEEMLRSLSRKLESLGQMASSIAHEIKTPLQYIGHNAAFVSDSFKEVVRFYEMIEEALVELEKSGNIDILPKIKELISRLDMEYIMAEIPGAAEQIINGVTRLSNIILAMNEFSHPGRGYKEKADINQLLQSTLVMVQSKIKQSADLQLELSEGLPPVSCYAGELNQVFMNLLINALDAVMETGRWGLIKIATAAEGGEILITIADTGCGIPEENREHVFNPFFTTKGVGKGTGQGLSLAHNVIVEKHKGKIDLISQVGKGTTFYIRLPLEGEH